MIAADINANLLNVDGTITRVQPQQAIFMHVLIEASPDVITDEQMIDKIRGIRDLRPTGKLLAVHCYWMRDRLKNSKYRIRRDRRNKGYYLVEMQ